MLQFFDAEMCDLQFISESERLFQIHSSDGASLYAYVPKDADAEEVDDLVRTAFRRQKRYSDLLGYEDVTDLYFDEDGNAREGDEDL